MTLEERLQGWTKKLYKKGIADCDSQELYYSILNVTKDLMAEKPAITGDKKVYYISAEFLIGKLLSNNLINLQIYGEMEEILAARARAWRI